MPSTKAVSRKRKPKLPIPMPGKDYELDLPSRKGLSFSQIETYLKCPLQYFHERVLGLERGITVHLQEGQAMARLLHDSNMAFLKKGRHLTFDEAYKSYDRHCARELAKVPEDGWYGETKLSVIERGEQFVTLYWRDLDTGIEQMLPVTVGKKPGTELPFQVEIAGVPLTSVIDVVEERAVIDVKVASDARWYSAETSLQLDLYAVVLDQLGHSVRRKGYVIFQKKKMAIADDFKPVHLPSARKHVEVTVSNVAKAISQRVFPPCQPNTLCSDKWCNYWSHCMGKMR